jgi:pyridoxine 5-phosphate synthase
MIALSINLNKIALIRNSRAGDYPSVSHHAEMIVAAGADGITIHPRPDQRHIRAADAAVLKSRLEVELNIEGNPFAGAKTSDREGVDDYPGFMALVLDTKPAQCTLVPDTESQLTSDHGFDLHRDAERLLPLIEALHSTGIRVSLFMDPEPAQIELAAQIGADRIELYTGPYAARHAAGEPPAQVLAPYRTAAECAARLGLGLNAGHDLNLHNLADFATISTLSEVSIGHAFTVDALQSGLTETVRAYQHCLGKPGNE